MTLHINTKQPTIFENTSSELIKGVERVIRWLESSIKFHEGQTTTSFKGLL